MEKIIKIGDKEVKLNNNMGWTLEYKEQFGTDILPKIMPLVAGAVETLAAVIEENQGDKLTAQSLAAAVEGRTLDLMLPFIQVEFVDLVLYVLWAMAKNADETIDPPKKWLTKFETCPLDEIVPELYKFALTGMVSAKNLKRLMTLKEKLKDLEMIQP